MSNYARLNYYSNVTPLKIKWLWYPYIAFGKLTMIQGDPGSGKTTLSLILAASLSKGENEFHIDGLDTKEVINVIYQTAEDGIEDTIKPKLDRLMADCTHISYITNDDYINLENDSIENIIKNKNIKLLILDPIQSFLGKGKSLQQVSDIRPLMKNLSKIAQKTGCAIVLIGHLNKTERSKDLYRGLGSVDLTAIARSIIFVRKLDENNNIRIITQIKNSLEKEGDSLAFKIEKNGNILWLGHYEIDDFEINDKDNSTIAKDILINMLADGMKPLSEIQKQTDSYISRRTLFRIKKELDIKTVYENKICYWKI